MRMAPPIQKSTKASNVTGSLAWTELRTISRELFDLDEAPLLGSPPVFPWKKLGEELGRYFGLSSCLIEPGELTWRNKDAIATGLAAPHFATAICASGIAGQLVCLFSRSDIESIAASVLKIGPFDLQNVPADFIDGFQRFLAVEVVFLINNLDFDKKLSFRLLPSSQEQSFDTLSALGQDIEITVNGHKILARLIIPEEFRSAWKANYSKGPQRHLSKERLEAIPITIAVEAARSFLSINELLSLQLNDILFPDHTFHLPDSKESSVMLSFAGRLLFRAKLAPRGIEIIEILLHHEVYDPMVDKFKPETKMSAQKNPAPEKSAPEEDDDPFQEEDGDDDYDLFPEDEEEDFDLISEDHIMEEAPSAPAPISAKSTPAKKEAPAAVAPVLTALEPLSPQNIQITLVVEVAQLQISVQKLLELAPGNMLDLDITPENGVNLVVNGKIIGRGELIKVGEAIGIRILEIGV
jgi:flagellar motor switch protein FliN/FliY